MSTPPDTINCIECGGTAHLISFLPEDEELEVGYPITYTCAECNHRHDLVWEGEDDD